MTREESEAVIRKYLRAWNTGNVELFEEVLAPDFKDTMYGQPRTREMIFQQAQDSTLIDRHTTIDDVLCDGDKIAVRVTSLYTHRESDKPITITGMIKARIENSKMVEGWGLHDRVGQLQQLDVLPEGEALRRWVRERLEGTT